MLVWLTRFGSSAGMLDLPEFEPVDDLDAGGYRSQLQDISTGGAYDPSQGERLRRSARTIRRSGLLLTTTVDALEASYNALAATSGLDGRLYGQSEGGSLAVHTQARMTIDQGRRAPRDIYRYQGYWALDIAMSFELSRPIWKGTRHGTLLKPLDTLTGLDLEIPLDDLADTYTLSSTPITLSIPNNGTAEVDDAVLTVLPSGSDLTALALSCGKAAWTWTGTVKAGNSLIIDSGNASVAQQTVLTAPATAGATALTVANAAGTGYTAGSFVRIVLDDGSVCLRQIAGIGGTTTINLTTGISGPAASGREVWAAAYSGFVRDATLHTLPTWLRLAPGANSVSLTRTGGDAGSTVSFHYYDGYR